jgi:hypothetical protein
MALEDSLVAILGQNESPVGAGLLIGSGLVLTCSHVVNVALGRRLLEKGRPVGKIAVRVHGKAENIVAEIDPQDDAWTDPPASQYGGGDLCILKLPAGSVSKTQVNLLVYANSANREFRTVGFPEDWKGDLDFAVGDILGRDQYGLYVLRSRPAADKKGTFLEGQPRSAGVIHAGFSGAPVESGGSIIGLVTEARTPSDATAYMIPAALFPARFEAQRTEYANQVFESYPHVREFSSERAQRKLSDRLVVFDLRFRFCADYNEALEVHRITTSASTGVGSGVSGYKQDIDLSPIELARILIAGKDKNNVAVKDILLHAPGGAGKSSFLLELLQSSPDENLVPFLVDFSKGDEEKSSTSQINAKDQLKLWFDQYEATGDVEALLDLAKSPKGNLRPLLVIDGFNQARRQWGSVLETLTKLSKQILASASIIVADRMQDRGSAMEAFRHAVIPPMSPPAYRDALCGRPQLAVASDPNWYPILSSPLFLNLLLTIPQKNDGSTQALPSRFQILNWYFREECKFNSQDLRVLTDFAFKVYDECRQTAIPEKELADFYSGPGASLQERIEGKGLIHRLGVRDFEFRHQVLHDFLVALKEASSKEREDETLLRAPAFNIVSLDSASQDAIELAVEALQYPSELLGKRGRPLGPREFLTAVFDWNYWITLQCVASFDRRGDSPLPPWVRHAVYAHNLERRFDPFLHTVFRAERLRGQIPVSKDLTYINSGNRAEIAEAIRTVMGQLPSIDLSEDQYRQQWLDLYLRDRPFLLQDLEPLWLDPLLSWTAANTIRRFDNPPEVTEEIVRLYRISKATSDSAPKAAMFRWRLVHALGTGKSTALNKLAEIALDSYEDGDVRYGAFRSLIELAVTRGSAADRSRILDRIQAEMPNLFYDERASELFRVRRELRRTCAFNEPCVSGRQGWLKDWLKDGLPHFARILRTGENLAKNAKLAKEGELWNAWASAAENVPTGDDDWEQRRQKWMKAIELDQ